MGEAPKGEVMVQMKYGPADFRVDYELSDGTQVKDAEILKQPIATATRPRAYAYLLPRDARQAVAILQRHNISVEVLQREISLPVEAYKLKRIDYLREYNHQAAVKVVVDEVVSLKRRFPVGTFVVSTAQLQGRLVAHMLEPETNDNVVRWNAMDALLPKTRMADARPPVGAKSWRRRVTGGAGARRGNRGIGRRPRQRPPVVPIYKLMSRMPLPTKLLD